MTKDFKQQAVADSGMGQYGASWMLGGIAMGLVAGLLMYVLASKDDGGNTAQAQTIANTTQYASVNPTQTGGTTTDTTPAMRDVPADTTSRNTSPGFSYHAVLPQLEVGIPIAVQEEQAAQAKAEAKPTTKKEEKPAQTPAEQAKATADAQKKPEQPASKLGNANGFQLGAYKTQEQAAALQNRLKKNGLNTRIEPGLVNGETWFRVRIGPATSPEMLQKWQQTLSGMGISALPIRM